MAEDKPKHVNEHIVDLVTKNPGITLDRIRTLLSELVKAGLVTNRFNRSRGYMSQRLDRMVKSKKLRKLVFKAEGKGETFCCHYYPPDIVKDVFDLSIELDRLVAADFAAENDDPIEHALRRARRGG